MTTNDLPTPERIGELIEFYTTHVNDNSIPLSFEECKRELEVVTCLRELRRTMMTEEMAMRSLVGAIDGAGNLNSFGPCNDIMYKRGESDA